MTCGCSKGGSRKKRSLTRAQRKSIRGGNSPEKLAETMDNMTMIKEIGGDGEQDAAPVPAEPATEKETTTEPVPATATEKETTTEPVPATATEKETTTEPVPATAIVPVTDQGPETTKETGTASNTANVSTSGGSEESVPHTEVTTKKKETDEPKQKSWFSSFFGGKSKKAKQSKKHRKTQKRGNPELVVGLIHSNNCGHCIAMREAWNEMKNTLNQVIGNRFVVVEVEAAQIPHGLNKLKRFTNEPVEIQGGYPTLYKIKNHQVQYYNGARDHQSLTNWYLDK